MLAMPSSLRRSCWLCAALPLVLLAAACGSGGGKKAEPPRQSSAGVSLADPADGIVIVAPNGTENVTDPTEQADVITGIANSGPVDPRLKIIAKKANPHSYYLSTIELWVEARETTPADVASQEPEIRSELVEGGATRISTRMVTAGGQPAIRADFLKKGSEGQLSDGTELFLWRKGKLYLITVFTIDSAPERGLADAVLASVRFSV
jgi:hypothetical protein